MESINMKKLEELIELNDDEFKRLVGISNENYQLLLVQLQQLIDEDKERNPMKKRGIKGKLTLGQHLLLTLYYLRHYATFQILGNFFGISESYCCKIYQKISMYLLKILHVSGRKALINSDFEAVVIDVTEQPIERPTIGQKGYYSGKKNSIQLKFN